MESGAEDEKAFSEGRLARALTHPQRVRIFAALSNECVVGPEELSRSSGTGLSKVAYHFKVLEKLGGLGVAGGQDTGEDDPKVG